MKEESIDHFLQSGLLQQYVMGLTSKEESLEVEDYIQKYPKVKQVYTSLLEEIEAFSKEYPTGNPRVQHKKSYLTKGMWALLVLGLVCVTYCNMNLQSKVATLEQKYQHLAEVHHKQAQHLLAIEDKKSILTHSATRKIEVQGKDVQGIVFYNAMAKKTLIHFEKLPVPPRGQCFQLWSDVDGEMHKMGVVTCRSLKAFAIDDNAKSINLTLEPKCGSSKPTTSQLVASSEL